MYINPLSSASPSYTYTHIHTLVLMQKSFALIAMLALIATLKKP